MTNKKIPNGNVIPLTGLRSTHDDVCKAPVNFDILENKEHSNNELLQTKT